MFKVSTLTAALAVACSIVPTAMAQTPQNTFLNTEEKVQQLPTVVVTASRTAQPINRAIGDITVIDGVQLRQNNDANVLRTLARESGIQMYDSGGPQTASGISIRGAWGDQNLIMLNGIRINNPVAGNSIPWGTLNPRAFERIEVIRGSASSLWGSSAMGGVVNLVTELAPGQIREFSPYADIGFGSDSTVRTGAGFSGADGTFDYSLNAQHAKSDGHNATTKDNIYNYNPDDDGYEQHSLSGSFGWTWAPEQRIGMHFFNSYNSGDYDAGEFDSVGANVKNRQQIYGISSQNKISDFWHTTLRYGFTKSAMANYTSGIASASQSYQNTFSWQNSFYITPDHMLSLLYEGTKERISSDLTQFVQNKRNTNSLGAIYQGRFTNRHHLQASVRNDHYSDYGSRTTSSLAYDYDVTDTITLGLAGNTGFRMPTFIDLYAPLWGGNPALKPEKSRNYEAHISFENETTTASIRVFHTKYRDLISYLTVPPYTAENINKAKTTGLSLTASHNFPLTPLGQTSIYAGFDFLNAKNEETKENLVRRARQVYRVGLEHSYDRFDFSAEFMHIGSRPDIHSITNQRTRLAGYGVVNLSAKAQLNKEFSAQIYWNNILDKKYTPAHGYRSQGSNVFVNLSWQPKNS